MTNFIIVDADILIDVTRNDATAIARLYQLRPQYLLALSAAAQMEILVGCRNKAELQATEKFLQRFLILKISEQISDRAVDLIRQYNLSHNLLMPDAFMAATALELNAPFITKNQRDYRFIAGLHLLPYP